MTPPIAPAPAVPFTSYQKLVIALLALLQFTVVLDFMVLAPLGDILMKELVITPQRFGVVVSSYAFSAGASGLLAASFADKFDRKKLLLFFYSGFILGTLGCAVATSYEMLLAARIVAGLFGGVISAIAMTIVSDLFALAQRGRVMGVVQMGFSVSQVLGIPTGLYLANRWGWHSTFLLIAVLALGIGATILLRLQPVTGHLALQTARNPFQHLWHTITNRSYQVGFVATALLSVGGFMLMPFSSAYMVNNVGISHHDLPFVFMLTGVSSLITMPLIGRLSDRVDKFRLFVVGSGLAIVIILIFTRLGPAPLWQVATLNVLMFSAIMSRMIPAMALSASIPGPQDRGAFMSVNASLQQVAGGIAAVVAGMIVTQRTPTSPLARYDTLGLIVASVVGASCFLVYRVSQLVKHRARVAAGAVPAEAVAV